MNESSHQSHGTSSSNAHAQQALEMPKRSSPAFRNKRKRLVLGEGWTDESAAENGGFSSFSSSGEDEDDGDADMSSVTQADDAAEPCQPSNPIDSLADSLMRSPSIIHEVSSSSEDESENFGAGSRAKNRCTPIRRSSSHHKKVTEEHNDHALSYPTTHPQPQLRRRNSKKLTRRKSNENVLATNNHDHNRNVRTPPPFKVQVLVPFPSSTKRRNNHKSTSSRNSVVPPTKPHSAVQQLPIQPPLKLRIFQKTRALKAAVQHFSKSPDKKKMLQEKFTERMESIKSEGDLQLKHMKLRWAPDISSYNDLSTLEAKERPKRKSRIILLSSNHPLKITWDFLTVILTFLSAYYTHTSIRDRSTYEWNAFSVFTYTWFLTDILLNFITSHVRSDGTVLNSGRAVWSRYLTTWFVIDALSLLPWERMFVKPIIEMQNRRNFATKWLFRSKAVVKVTRILRGKHFRFFGRLAKETKQYGVGGQRLLRLIIKYVPKYIMFYRNMKGVLVLKVLRQIHFARKIRRSLSSAALKSDDECEDQGDHGVSTIDNAVLSCETGPFYEDDDREASERDLVLGYYGGDDCEVSSAGVVDQSDSDDSLTGESYVSRDDLKSSQNDNWLSQDDSWLT